MYCTNIIWENFVHEYLIVCQLVHELVLIETIYYLRGEYLQIKIKTIFIYPQPCILINFFISSRILNNVGP